MIGPERDCQPHGIFGQKKRFVRYAHLYRNLLFKCTIFPKIYFIERSLPGSLDDILAVVYGEDEIVEIRTIMGAIRSSGMNCVFLT